MKTTSCPSCGYVMPEWEKDCIRCKTGVNTYPLPHQGDIPPTIVETNGRRILRTDHFSLVKKVAPWFIILATLSLLYFYKRYTSTPQYALLQARNAVLSRDLKRFEYYVDISSCSNQLSEDLYAHKSGIESSTGENDPGNQFKNFLSQGIAILAQPLAERTLEDQAHELVENWLVSSDYTDLPIDMNRTSAELALYSFHSIGAVKIDDDAATAVVIFEDIEKHPQLHPLTLEMSWDEGRWQVTGFQDEIRFLEEGRATFR